MLVITSKCTVACTCTLAPHKWYGMLTNTDDIVQIVKYNLCMCGTCRFICVFYYTAWIYMPAQYKSTRSLWKEDLRVKVKCTWYKSNEIKVCPDKVICGWLHMCCTYTCTTNLLWRSPAYKDHLLIRTIFYRSPVVTFAMFLNLPYKDHLFIRTTLCWSLGWSLYTSFTVHCPCPECTNPIKTVSMISDEYILYTESKLWWKKFANFWQNLSAFVRGW